MTPSLESDRILLAHIFECVERVQEYTHGDQQTFVELHIVQDAVVRNLQTLAESTQRLSESLKNTEPDIPWRKIAGFRNALTHDYITLDLDAIWQVIENDLAPLTEALERMTERVNRDTEL